MSPTLQQWSCKFTFKKRDQCFRNCFPWYCTSGTESRLERQLPYFEALDRGWTDLPGNGSISLQGRGKGPQREFHSSNSQDSSFIWPRLFHRIELLQTTIWFLFITNNIGLDIVCSLSFSGGGWLALLIGHLCCKWQIILIGRRLVDLPAQCYVHRRLALQ